MLLPTTQYIQYSASRSLRGRNNSATSNPTSAGFSLIEVIIVIAIIGILTAIAYPQYGNYVQQGRRADGRLALLEEVQNMERCKSTQFSYANCSLTKTESSEALYDLTLAKTASTFTITATGKGPQVSDPNCKIMTINHQSALTPDPSTTRCWPS